MLLLRALLSCRRHCLGWDAADLVCVENGEGDLVDGSGVYVFL